MQNVEVMNFLNEVSAQFPEAISLASGRPNSMFFDRQNWDEYQSIFLSYYADKQECSETVAKELLCQYGPSAGIINVILQKYLASDESIHCAASNIIVTNGCQEALALLCLHELQNENDCMLTIDPSYIGFSGLLTAIGKRVEPIDINRIYSTSVSGDSSFDWLYLSNKVTELKQQGLTSKALYINPDFNNPLSYRLSLQDRLLLLEACFELGIKIIEDNPYSRFDYSNNPILSLKALDKHNIVYHIGSFSKTFCPTVRIGYLIVPDKQEHSIKSLVSLKSLLSVNTSSLPQSIIGGFLIKNKFRISKHMASINLHYSSQRDAMIEALDIYCSNFDGISWNIPQGGFFAVIKLPFNFSSEDVFDCASKENVICMPIGFFSLKPELWQGQLRLAFSYYKPDELAEGILRLSRYIERRLLASK